MGKNASRLTIAPLLAAMIIPVVVVDLLFFRVRLWTRLIANVAIIVLFGAAYLSFVRPR